MLMGREANGKSSKHRSAARILHAISSIEVTRQQIFFDIARQRIGNVVGNKNDTTACTRTPQKWPKRGKSGSGDTIGIRVPLEDALRKIAFNVASASGERGKKNTWQERTNLQ